MNTMVAASALSLSALMMSPVVHAAGPRFVPQSATYAEKVKELEGVGGDPSFLEPPTSWDGSIDESAHFGGWEEHAGERTETSTTATVSKRKQERAATKTPEKSNKHNIVHQLSYMERKREIEAVGGDPSFLDRRRISSLWDGSIDEGAHFGGWES